LRFPLGGQYRPASASNDQQPAGNWRASRPRGKSARTPDYLLSSIILIVEAMEFPGISSWPSSPPGRPRRLASRMATKLPCLWCVTRPCFPPEAIWRPGRLPVQASILEGQCW